MSSMTPSATVNSPTRSRRELVAWRNAVFAIFFLSGLSMASWVARIPAVRDDTSAGLQLIGLMILGASIGSIIGLAAAPVLLARFGARRSMIFALVVVSIGMGIIGLGSTVFALPVVVAVGMALFGFGNGSVDVMMNVEGALAEKANGKTLMPLMHAFFSFGTLAGAGIGAAASALSVNVLWHMVVVAVLIAVAIFIAVRFVPVREEAEDVVPEGPKPPFRDRLRENLTAWADLRLILIGVIMLGMSFAEGGANDWLTLASVDGHGMDNTTGALIFGVFTAAMTGARVLGGPVLDRFGRVPVLRACSVIGVVGLLLFIYGGEMWMLLLGTVLWALGCSLGFPVGMSAAADHPTRAAARVSAVAMIGYLAFLAGPPLLGFIGEQLGILNALLVLVGLMILSGLAAPAARESGTRVRAS